jgi:hypothetical protein
MANNQPKVRRLSGESAEKSGESAEPAQGFAAGHPIFGTAPVVSVTITRLRYRNGDGRTPPIRTPLAPIPPNRLIDLGVIGQLYGPGRYDVRGVDERGALAWRPECVDCPDEEGNLHLIAPSPQLETTTVAAVAAAAPQIQKDMLDIYKDIAAQAERSRANDFQAFVKLMEAQRAAPSSGGELVSFLHAELGASRARCAELERRLEDSREDGQKSRDTLLRKTLTSDGKDDLFTKALQVAVERFGGGVLPVTPGAATAQGTAPDEIRLPSAEELAGMLYQGVVPQSVIVQAVKLHRAGGLRPDLWALVEPVAAMAGLL